MAIKVVAPLLFDRRYLRGRHFEQSTIGWSWVFRAIWFQKILGFNRSIPWPINPHILISNHQNLVFDVDDLNNFQSPGCYYQNFAAQIVVGKGTFIAPNVGIITANHDPENLDLHLPGSEVHIGERCWLGMNSVILPGVTLGPGTVVGAGSVVSHSFPDGNCVIAGTPAKVIRSMPQERPVQSPMREPSRRSRDHTQVPVRESR
jgi:acetyltransferase-like isoleucine patch superfamily enzyme